MESMITELCNLRDTNTTALNAIIGAVDRDALLGSSDIEHILGGGYVLIWKC